MGDVTVSQFLLDSTLRLRKAGIENPRLESELLLSAALQIPRERLLLQTETRLEPACLTTARALVSERERRVPLQYLTGTVEFMGLEFEVTRGVFIPRPETEFLVEETSRVIGELRAPGARPAAEPGVTKRRASSGNARPGELVVLEVGTGSGVIAVSLAVAVEGIFVHATDISPEAIETAKSNARRHAVSKMIEFHQGDLFEAGQLESLRGQVDVLVSNPPYVPSGEIPCLEPEVAVCEPSVAIDGGGDGLNVIRNLLDRGRGFVRRDGLFLVEIGAGQWRAVRELAHALGLRDVRTVRDIAGIERVLVAVNADA